MSSFKAQQKAVSEQMHKVLKGTPLDTWLKMSEQNMQMWNQVQRNILKSLTHKSLDKSE
jgi:polyhydroxyalkanoate synthesis regulator protein